MANEMGRPKNYSTEEIKNVVDSYVTFTGGTVLLNASKIAKYANEEFGLPNFKYYVINRSAETKKYLEDLNERITGVSNKKLSISKSVFTQIDINRYLSMKADDLKISLSNLNILMEDMANLNTELIKETIKLRNRIQEKDIEIRRLNKEIADTNDSHRKDFTDSKEKLIGEKRKTLNLSDKVKQQDDLLHVLWDREAETILKQNGIFENDGVELNENRVISDVTADIIKEVKDIFPDVVGDKISYKLINKLKNI